MENVDTFNGVRICCFVLGVGMLTPWSIVVGALDYWQNVTATDTMNADMSFVFMAFNFIFLWGCIYAVGRYDFFKENGTTAISSGFVLFLLPLLIVTTDSSPSYGLLIFLSALLGAGQAVTQTETMRLIARLPPQYTSDCVSGQALAGFFFSSLRLATKSSGKKTTNASTVGIETYFWIGNLIVVVSFCVSVILPKLSFSKYQLQLFGEDQRYDELSESRDVLMSAKTELPGQSLQVDDSLSRANQPHLELSLRETAMHLRHYCGMLFLVFFASLMVFPALVSEIPSSEGLKTWFPTINSLVFNLFDLIGRLVAPIWTIEKHFWKYFIIGRLVVFPFIFCMAAQSVIQSDLLVYISMAFLAFTNGYFASVLIVAGPDAMHKTDRPKAAQVMVIMLVLGLACGSFAGMPLAHAMHDES
jgi:hypothetical protein